MAEHHIGEIIDSLSAARFGHPGALAAEIAELTTNVASMDEIIAQRWERLQRLAYDQPELDDLEFHVESKYQLDLIAAWERRRAEDMSRAVAQGERLTGDWPPAADA